MATPSPAPVTIDPEIAALADAAALWLACASVCAQALGVQLPAGIEALKVHERIYTGYMPEPQRRNVTHRLLRDGVRGRKLSRDPSAKAKADARRWGHEVRP